MGDRVKSRYPPPIVRFYDGLRTNGECVEWAKGKSKAGYGLFYVDGKLELVHRFSYKTFVGPIPNDLEIDHLCRNRACVNVWHLEPVTHQVNCLRGDRPEASKRTYCINGHAYTPENTYLWRNKWKVCQICARRRKKAYKAKMRERDGRPNI